jgi:protein phosphatase
MGAVLAGIEIFNDTITFVHYGDSKAILIRNDEVIHETQDHSPVQVLINRGIISATDALFHPDRHYVDKAIALEDGEPVKVEAETFSTKIELGDRILLATDGLWDNMTADEAGQLVSIAPDAPSALKLLDRTLRDLVQKNGKEDNLAMVVYEHLPTTQRQSAA